MLCNYAQLLHQGIANPSHSMCNKGKGGSAPAPDYTPMAQASKEAAEIGAQLGREQLAENKRQYDLNAATLAPAIQSQQRLMDQAYEQGAANYATYQNEGRPIQQQLAALAMGGDYTAAQRAKQEEAVGMAIADARAGSNQQMQQLIRQGLRYGWSPAKLAAMGGSYANQGMQTQVAAANGARMQKQSQQLAQMGDVYNTYAGAMSSAPSFYSAGTQAGNAASGSQLGMSGQYINGMNAGNGTIMQGQGMRVQGLGNILNSQTSVYNASQAAAAQSAGGLGSLIGTGIGAYAALS